MDRSQFTDALAQQGFAEAIVVQRPADGFLDLHSHTFAAQALILDGEIRLTVDGLEQRYQVGQVFHLAAHQLHTETYGPQGVRYLVGRKESA